MKQAEQESFTKSFFVFFISLSLLSSLVFWYDYNQKRDTLEENIFNDMKVCSFNLDCEQFTFDFVPLKMGTLYLLNKDESGYFALFSIPSGKYALKIHMAQSDFDAMLDETQESIIKVFLLTLLFLAFISAIFSFYTLYPLKKALHLTEEFSRDILHDFNTPLSSLRLNVSLLKVDKTENKKIERIEQSIETMVSLGNNLRTYIQGHVLQRESIELHAFIEERVKNIEKLYSHISFNLNNEKLYIDVNHDAISRIIDNLLSNAAKYNKKDGSLWIRINSEQGTLHIDDNGVGIKDTQKIFERFYKEHERGLGIGLHIVKKLCDELEIPISVESTLDKGSQFTLDFTKLIGIKKELV